METEISDTKTGAVVCVKAIQGTEDLEYKALLFITQIPIHTADAELEKVLGTRVKALSENCVKMLIRADINATSNEIAEQFNFHEDNTERILFKSLL